MRPVAKFQFQAPNVDADATSQIESIIKNWIDKKFDIVNGKHKVKMSSRVAEVLQYRDSIADSTRIVFNSTEEIEGGSLTVQSSILS